MIGNPAFAGIFPGKGSWDPQVAFSPKTFRAKMELQSRLKTAQQRIERTAELLSFDFSFSFARGGGGAGRSPRHSSDVEWVASSEITRQGEGGWGHACLKLGLFVLQAFVHQSYSMKISFENVVFFSVGFSQFWPGKEQKSH